jgi:hypothetical protein
MEGDEGEAKLQAAANWRDNEIFSAEERLALDYAERMTIIGQRVDDTLFTQLKARFSEAQIVELTAAVALETSEASSIRRSESKLRVFACSRSGETSCRRGSSRTLGRARRSRRAPRQSQRAVSRRSSIV